MKSKILLLFLLLSLFVLSPETFAGTGDNITGFDNAKLRSGDFSFDDIPALIVNVIEFLLAIAGSVSIVAIIYGGLQMQLNSGIFGKSDEKGKKMITAGIVGFIISLSSWYAVTKFVEIFSGQ